MNHFKQLIKPGSYYWEQLLKLLEQQEPTDSSFLESLQTLAVGSNYAIAQLIKYPVLISKLQDCSQFKLESSDFIESMQDTSDLDEIKHKLRFFRHWKLLEIIYLDLCRQEPVENTLLHLSQLADLLIQQALSKAQQILSDKHGVPQDEQGNPMQLNVIGMGKLGGRELNFSSDIDLICCYSQDGKLSGFGKLTYNQYFIHVVKLFKQLLHETTKDGFVYRVDLRLRPWGDSGPVVLSHNAFEHYYQLHGREWEQYAMVKARVISGSEADRNHLKAIIKPFVYRRYHDYRVFEGLALLKHKIDQQASRKGSRHNIKIGRGGIREIEFFVQAFQILKGGRNQSLQTASLFQALETLSEQAITDPKMLNDMRAAYCYLRKLENRLQMFNDQQTHELPLQQNQRDRVSQLLSYTEWGQLEQELTENQSLVNKVFSGLFISEQEPGETGRHIQFLDELDEQQHLAAIQQLAFRDADKIHHRLREFYQSKALLFMSDKAKKRFHAFFPELLKQVSQHDRQFELLEKMLGLLTSIAGRSVYFELLYQNIPLLVKLVQLFNCSNWIAAEVTRHPILIESLLYPGELENRFDRHQLQQALQVQLKNVENDEELELDVLRQFKRSQTIVIATAEIAREIDTLEVSRYLSELAEILLQAVYELSLDDLNRQYGEAHCIIDDKPFSPTLGIIAYGKLGGYELHYQSDLDIIFLHNSSGTQQHTTGQKSIDNAVFFSRLAQKIISRISLVTAAGKLYEIDTRLRPDGASGMLVSSLTAYRHYQLEKAWVWEHQAIIRARYIAGNPIIKAPFDEIRQQVVALTRQDDDLKKAITDMRDKIYRVKKPIQGETINIKHSRGCLVDIEFLVQYRVLKYANKFASLLETTDNAGLIIEMHRLGLISDDELHLKDIYQKFHSLLHSRVLQNRSAEISSTRVSGEMSTVTNCWNKTFNH